MLTANLKGEMEDVMDILFIIISSIATVVIAIYAWLNYKLISKVHFFSVNIAGFNDDKRRESEASMSVNHVELTDILKAIVISNLLVNKSSPDGLKESVDLLMSEYYGRTQIFSSEAKKTILNR